MTRRPLRLRPRSRSGRADAAGQLVLLAGIDGLYELVRGLLGGDAARATRDAAGVIDLERRLHVFVEPAVQSWAVGHAWLIEAADWIYLNAQFTVTAAALTYVYLRHRDRFGVVRTMFVVAMLLALVAYAAFPTAPPRLMPAWGFGDPVARFTGGATSHGAAAWLLNPYAAIPSMHVCFALMIGGPLGRLARRRIVRAAWWLYPGLVTAVVVATGNHYLLDVILGALTAGIAAGVACGLPRLRTRLDAWGLNRVPAATVPGSLGRV